MEVTLTYICPGMHAAVDASLGGASGGTGLILRLASRAVDGSAEDGYEREICFDR